MGGPKMGPVKRDTQQGVSLQAPARQHEVCLRRRALPQFFGERGLLQGQGGGLEVESQTDSKTKCKQAI